MKFFILSCKKSAELVNKKYNDKLNFWEQFRLNIHIKMCKVCDHFDHQQSIIDEALKKLEKPSENLSVKMKEHIKNTIENVDD